MTSPARSPIRVAVIGGGCAALTTAFELTRPEHRGRYEVTVYQQGWRLGGKGASGRGVASRIEEHGLHLWMGFYENAFRLMRESYRELGRDWSRAFQPAPDVALTDRLRSGGWQHWIAHFPKGNGEPGDPLTRENPFTVRGYLRRSAQLLVELLRAARFKPNAPAAAPPPGGEGAAEAIDRLLRLGQLATAAAVVEAAELLRAALDTLLPHPASPAGPRDLLLRLIDAIAAAAHRQLDLLVSGDDELRRIWQVADLVLAILRGSVRFNLAFHPRGFDAIDDYDWRAWLRLNGASEASLDSGFIRGIYDLVFGYEDGDVRRPSLSAAVALRGAMRMFFTYRGSMFWRMRAGMGDVVFAPLYEVLKRRGARFRFFHRLRNVGLSPATQAAADEAPHVEALDFDVQAEVKGGGEYRPLVTVRGLPCWPAEPDWEQLVDGPRLREERWALESQREQRRARSLRLKVVEDFDLVVLGVGVAALPYVAPELLERNGRWRRMAQEVKTAATQALQLWLTPDLKALGWMDGPVNLSGFAEPFDTWADMGHLLPEEEWRTAPGTLAYFCGVLPEEAASPPGQAVQRVRANAVHFLERELPALWPGAARRPGGFRWELLHHEQDGVSGPAPEGEARLDTQYYRANVEPTERFSLSPPGSSRHRISPLDMAFDNLTVAGDWTESGLNSGCVESAVMSGLLASHAISGAPPLEHIIGYDHP
jgi:uncharacterized protein with NAD-binding domain and iron-sulfur cluster